METNNNQKINNIADLSETFGTLKTKMTGQEFKDLVREIEPVKMIKRQIKDFPKSLKSSFHLFFC